MVQPVNKKLVCFTVWTSRNGTWRRECYQNAPGVPYKFFEEKDARSWALRNLPEETEKQFRLETFLYNSDYGTWL